MSEEKEALREEIHRLVIKEYLRERDHRLPILYAILHSLTKRMTVDELREMLDPPWAIRVNANKKD